MRKSQFAVAVWDWFVQTKASTGRAADSDAEVISRSGVKRATFYRLKRAAVDPDSGTVAKLAVYLGVAEPRWRLAEDEPPMTVLGLIDGALGRLEIARDIVVSGSASETLDDVEATDETLWPPGEEPG